MMTTPPKQPCITVWRGSPPWAPHWEFIGFEKAGVLIIGINSYEGWRFGQHGGEVWIYFRTQHEWRWAWRMARIVAREWSFPARSFHGFASVWAYKPAYEEHLIVNYPTVQRLEFKFRALERDMQNSPLVP